MVETLRTLLGTLLLLFRSRPQLQVEILVLRQQLIVLRRTAPKRVRLRALGRLLFVLLYRLWPGILDSVAVIRPDTIVRWHRTWPAPLLVTQADLDPAFQVHAKYESSGGRRRKAPPQGKGGAGGSGQSHGPPRAIAGAATRGGPQETWRSSVTGVWFLKRRIVAGRARPGPQAAPQDLPTASQIRAT
jgi:hypothetical protein